MASGAGFWPEGPEAILIDNRGKIVASGSFAKIHSEDLSFIGRLNPYDSTLDDWRNWKVQEFGESFSDPLVAGADLDSDFDGRANLIEFALGSNPVLRDKPALEVGILTSSQYSLDFIPPVEFSGAFKIQASDSLDGSQWRDLAVYSGGGVWNV